MPCSADASDSIGVGPLAVLAAYLIVLLGIAWHAGRSGGPRTLQNHYLAGDGLGLFVLGLTLYATVFSGYTLLGVPGSAYRVGYLAFYWVPGQAAITVAQLFVAPRLFKLAKIRHYITPSAYLLERYGCHVIRVTSAFCFVVPMFVYVVAQLKSMANLMDGLTQSKEWSTASVVVLAAVMLLYESLGGMTSVAFTDVVQGFLMITGFVAMFFISTLEFGGLEHAGPLMRQKDPALTAVPDGASMTKWVSWCILIGVSYPFNPIWLQRLFAARGSRDLRVSYSILGFTPLLATLPAAVVGWTAIPRYDLSSGCSDSVFGLLSEEVMQASAAGWVVVSILVAASVAALMSTADSALLCFSSIFTLDLVKPYLWTNAREEQLLRLCKVSSFVVTAISVALVRVHVTLQQLVSLQTALALQVAPLFYLGLHTELHQPAALAGLLAGMSITIGVTAYFAGETPPHGLIPGVVGLLGNIVVLVGTELLHRAVRRKRPGDGGATVDDGRAGTPEAAWKELREPLQYRNYTVVVLALLAACCPWYRRPGAQDDLVGGMPVWLVCSLALSVLLAIASAFGHMVLWVDTDHPIAQQPTPDTTVQL